MAQHSDRFPACLECWHRIYDAHCGDPCGTCSGGDRFTPTQPGEAGEVVDWAAWAEDTHDACAEGHVPAWPPVKIKPAAE